MKQAQPKARNAAPQPSGADLITSTEAHTPAARPTKQEKVVALLRLPTGSTILTIMEATGWQAHSVRGFFTSVVRQKLGLELTSELIDGTRTYRVVTPKPSKIRSGGRKTAPSAEAQA